MKKAKQFTEQIKTSIFAPMHFSEHHDGGNAFRETARTAGSRFIIINHRGEFFDV